MDLDRWPDRPAVRGAARLGLVGGFVLLCGLPYLSWLDHPSLYHDDFMRAGSLRNSTLGESLFRPFNEHMAPLFETVSYLAWLGAGREIRNLPTAFLVASFVAFGATVGMLGALIRRETGSTTSALIALAFFTLSSVSAETVLWYSASSFQWAAAVTLGAWFCAASADFSGSSRVRKCWLIGSGLAAMIAPAFSAIGILAAPLAGLRLLAIGDRTDSWGRRLIRAAVPATGLAIYLLICAGFRYREVLSDSLSRNLDLGAALWATARAPAWALVPGLLGMPDQSLTMPGALAVAGSVALLVGSLVGAIRGRQRPLILGGLVLIAGGYLLSYAARAQPGNPWIMKVGRYHLFPQIGLVCLIAAASARLSRRLESRPIRGLMTATLLASALAGLQYRGMRLAAEGPFRFPDQPRLLAAEARLEALAKRESLSFDQLFGSLDPIQPRWAPHPWPFHPILFLFPRGKMDLGRFQADRSVRDAIIAGLSPEDRGLIFGGIEATRYRRPIPDSGAGEPPTLARLVATFRVATVGPGRYRAQDGPAYLEYEVDPSADNARAIALPGLAADWPVELWWAGPMEPWSPDRSVRWKPEPEPVATSVDWEVPIDAFPHWQRGSARRLRIVSGGEGKIVVGAPRFFR